MPQQNIFITGAAAGIGKETALFFAQKGWFVGLFDIDEAGLQKLANEIGNDQCCQHKIDVTNEDSVRAAISFFAEKTDGKMNVLFNNAGTGARPGSIETLSYEAWQRVVDANLTGTFLCTQGAFRIMKEQAPQGGRIINNGSISAQVPRPGSAPYTATKHGVTGLTRSTSLDGRAYNIVCSQIDIGNALTEMTARMSDGVPQADGSVRPEPTMDVRHVADAIVQMAGLPLEANVQFMTIMASAMPYIGRG